MRALPGRIDISQSLPEATRYRRTSPRHVYAGKRQLGELLPGCSKRFAMAFIDRGCWSKISPAIESETGRRDRTRPPAYSQPHSIGQGWRIWGERLRRDNRP